MSAITLNLSDELAARFRGHEDRLPEILERGLRELNAEAQAGFEGAAEVLEVLAGLPAPEEILNLRPSERFVHRVQELVERSRDGQLDSVRTTEKDVSSLFAPCSGNYLMGICSGLQSLEPPCR